MNSVTTKNSAVKSDADFYLDILNKINKQAGLTETLGLSTEVIEAFLQKSDSDLKAAISQAQAAFAELKASHPDIIALPESEQVVKIQSDFVNFYTPETVNPYVALAAQGPWIITTTGAVIHDSGGYGMLGLGHNPEGILSKMADKQVMANIMTANFEQLDFTNNLRKEIGHTRVSKKGLYEKFICINSGSEAVTVAARLSDVNAKSQTDKNAPHSGKTVKILALKGGFHGRTDRPSQFSDSSLPNYRKHLKSFSSLDNLITVRPNHIEDLEAVFEQAKKENIFFESFAMEPVMGEGDPGLAITPEFYQRARQLTKQMGTLLIVDSIQAGLRAQGVLSIVDYPGFEGLSAPDIESFSKALNAGQYPFSVLALSKKAADLYVTGIYGNTMTTNPRALATASAVLSSMTDTLRTNIVDKGQLFLEEFNKLKTQFPDIIKHVQGTGLLFSMEISSEIKVVGFDGLEEQLRRKGIGVIHGGENSLRFTPHFAITSDEVQLITSVLKSTLQSY